MKKYLTLIVLLYSAILFSQENSLLKSLRFGGDLGFSFGSNSTTFSVSPTIVYDFNENFSLGAGFGYLYGKNNQNKLTAISPKIIALYKPIETIEFSADLQQLYITKKTDSYTEKYNYPSLNLGAAYRLGVLSFGVKYDVLYKKEKSIYPVAVFPFVRVLF